MSPTFIAQYIDDNSIVREENEEDEEIEHEEMVRSQRDRRMRNRSNFLSSEDVG